ncbi:MAG TPA: secretin and TonB N-terminal domain-containing protein [Thermoguttaceae bacterium]|nr:secretin and TonB N-terminal domain-containing protein [Thermoguttaceae bacterium]
MRILGRLTLLSFFAATGVGLAVYVGAATSPSPGPRAAGYSVEQPPANRGENADPADKRGAKEPEKDVPRSSPQQDGAHTQENVTHTNKDGAHTQQYAAQAPSETPGAVAETSPRADVPASGPEADHIAASSSMRPAIAMPEGAVVAEPHPARAFQVASGGRSPGLLKSFRLWKAMATPLLSQVGRDLGPPPLEMAPSPPSAEDEEAANSPAVAPVPPVEARGTLRGIVPGEGDDELSMQVPDNDIREVLDALSVQGNLNILATDSVQGKVSASLTGVDVNSALDAILKSTGYVAKRDGDFIYVGKPEDFDDLEKALDTVRTRVYRPNYVTAAELNTLIQPLVTAGAGVVAVSSPAEVGIGADETNAGGDAFAGGEVVVVRDYEAVLTEIDQVVAEIDVRPMQVAIEAIILSVKLTDKDKLGINWDLLRQKNNLNFVIGTPPQTLPTKFTTGGLAVAFMDSNLGAFLDALEELNETNVIASPRLMVINKHRAEIQIGREQGYVGNTVQTSTSTTGGIEMLKTGTILRLRPFVSADGLIRMEVHPELSSGDVVVKGDNLVPDKEVTQVTSNIMVRDGCTVIIGGLMREELKTSGNQVPLLGNLRWVGPLFRNRDETTERHEIIVLITPHIVYEPETCEEGEQAACEFHRRQQVYGEKMTFLGKRHVARKYFRMAQNAWAAGDRNTALRFAELSIHFDPLNRAAIDLRSDVWLGRPVGEHTLGGPSPVVSPTDPLDGTVIDPWLLGELQRGPIPLSEPIEPSHPFDPGRPGRRVDIERPRSFQ